MEEGFECVGCCWGCVLFVKFCCDFFWFDFVKFVDCDQYVGVFGVGEFEVVEYLVQDLVVVDVDGCVFEFECVDGVE